VLWPNGFSSPFDVVSALITVAAAIALFRFKRDVMEVIAACSVVGLIVKSWIVRCYLPATRQCDTSGHFFNSSMA